ncbi:MAG: GyrI-like domain-containing protein [Defluviitaleaceae bacterium]|nr:GyrI-like domain-containing protein [Defluviitaleaceae bacterium]
MNMLDSLNEAVCYIEDNLDKDIDYTRIAKAAGYSQYHFQRMFVCVSGVTLSEYIRRRRLTLAAFELQNNSKKVIDVAFKYGYTSADSFTRAFHNMHGITPSKSRDKGVTLKAYPRITFALSIKGVVAMNYRIEEKEGFTVAGVKEFTSTADGVNFKNIPEMWAKLPQEDFKELMRLSDREPFGVLGVCADMYNDGFDYWIAAATTKPCPEKYSSMSIPSSTWAIFEVTGALPGAIQEMWKRIYSEWFPTSGYEHAPTPELECYSDGDPKSPDYKSEIWIPVIKNLCS